MKKLLFALAFSGLFGSTTASTVGDEPLSSISLHINDMHCDKCAHRILVALDSVEGIDEMTPNVAGHSFTITFDSNKTSKSDIRTAIGNAGYTPVVCSEGDKEGYAYFLIPKASATEATAAKALAIEGVSDAFANERRGSLAIAYTQDKTTVEQLLERLKAAGIEATVPAPHKCKEKAQKE